MKEYKIGQKYLVTYGEEKGNVIQITEIRKNSFCEWIDYKTISGTGICQGGTSFQKGSEFEDMLVPVVKSEIHITTDGIKNTYAVLKKDGKVVKHVRAKCHPNDEFDFEIAVAVVIDRLLESDVRDVLGTVKVGDRVEVVDVGKVFSSYERWFERINREDLKSHFVKSKNPKKNHVYKVVAVGDHELSKEKVLLGIQDLDTTQVFVIDAKGVKKA